MMKDKEFKEQLDRLLPTYNLAVRLSDRIAIPSDIDGQYQSLLNELRELKRGAKALSSASPNDAAAMNDFWEKLKKAFDKVIKFVKDVVKNIDWNQVLKVLSTLLELILYILQNVNTAQLSQEQLIQAQQMVDQLETHAKDLTEQMLHLEASQLGDFFKDIWVSLKAEKSCGWFLNCLPGLFSKLDSSFAKVIAWLMEIANNPDYDDKALTGALIATERYLNEHHRHSYQSALTLVITDIFNHSPLKYDEAEALAQAKHYSDTHDLDIPKKLDKVFKAQLSSSDKSLEKSHEASLSAH
jgi:hypothetical protein